MYVRVQVVSDAKKERVTEIKENSFKIEVREPAQGNMANMRVREILALEYLVDVGAVRITSGHHSPVKMFSIISSQNPIL